MATYDKKTAIALADELVELAKNVAANVWATPERSAELIDQYCEVIGKAISLLKTGK
jgi:hypothetical protein